MSDLTCEIHVTVAPKGGFMKACDELGVKPLFIELQSIDYADYITSHVATGNPEFILNETKRVHDGLITRGFNVIRAKVETPTYHPSAANPRAGQYFECHFKVRIPYHREELGVMIRFMKIHKNNLMHSTRGSYQIMTYRSKDQSKTDFLKTVEELYTMMTLRGLPVEKPTPEFCLYDSNIGHDKDWIQNNHNIFK